MGAALDYDEQLISRIVSEVVARLRATPQVRRGPAAETGQAAPARQGAEATLLLRNTTFLKDVALGSEPFADVGPRASVEDPGSMLRGWTRAAESRLTPEAQVGRFQTSPAALLHILAERRRAVGIVRASGRDFQGREGSWQGTGFLVARNLFITNHHMLNSREVAQGATVAFNFEIAPADLPLDATARPPAPQVFRLDPDRLFVTSPWDDGLDYTFVWIDEAAAAAHGSIPMERASFTVRSGDLAFVVHHPDGRTKQVSLDDVDVLSIQESMIHYSSDTLGGSSGAPVFDRSGRLIALHHASQPTSVALPDGGQTSVINEGIKIAAIALELESRREAGGVEAEQAATVLQAIKGSDTLAGFFGGLGRTPTPGLTGPELVVDAYNGSDEDIDIGFWNIEWLAREWRDPAKLDGAARVVMDLNLDAWGLSEVSPAALDALVRHISERFGEHYLWEASEPDAPEGRQSTGVIWKPTFLKGARVAWPAEIEPLLHMRSDDPQIGPEAVHGKIFDRYPGLFRFETVAGVVPFRFHVVPLHLKAMEEGSLRRRLASRILARGVQAVIAEAELDVILGGDFNAPLASGDFSAIEEAGFALLGAQDEREGAFTYLQSPRTPIDNIFLSPGMQQTVGGADYFIVARDRTMPNYLDISDHRPVAVRLSLRQRQAAAPPAGPADLDAIIERLLVASRAPAGRGARRGRGAVPAA